MPTKDNQRQRSVKDDVSSSFPKLRAHLDSERNKTNISGCQGSPPGSDAFQNHSGADKEEAITTNVPPPPHPYKHISILPSSNDHNTRRTLFRPAPMQLEDFEMGELLGAGTFGEVYKVRERRTDLVRALKVLPKETIRRRRQEDVVRREIEIHMNLKHDNIIYFHGYFQDTDNIYLILEHAEGGDLYSRLQDEKEMRFSELQAARYIVELAAALRYIHAKQVMHRDIKLENILVGNDGKIKLADFGWSIRSANLRNTVCGTLDYMPPEMIKPGSDKNFYSEKVDSWSLGVLIYEFLVGKPPFEDLNILTQRRIANCEMTVPEHVSPEAKDLIERLLVLDPEKRMSPTEVQEHAWIAQRAAKRFVSGN